MQRSSEYVDLQVNGYLGVDFNSDQLTAEDLHTACAAIRESGVAGILATIITDHMEVMVARLSRLRQLHEADPLVRETVWGIHIEGPFINREKGYVGAHPPDAVRPANLDDAKKLVEAAGGLARLVTLAPEGDQGMQVTRFLADAGVRVSAGHCNPSLEQLRAAIDAGLTLFTHLGNGCPAQVDRHDNIIQRVLSLADQLIVCWIADGIHVPFMALANYLKCVDFDRSLVVSDAISAAGLGPGRYSLGEHEVIVDENLSTCMDGDTSHLAGSATSLPQMAAKLRDQLGLTEQQVQTLCCGTPRRVLGL
ncbi:MAG: N-acetylglucosamine-6-phosphate deacetylase [Planctomycetales bacterium]|nr:N-acetylglucosamine-6-phosphate deacetylase [Planctomycetales bacterium]